MGTVDDGHKDEFCDMNIFVDKNSGIIYIDPVLDLSLVYMASHNSGAIGATWENHHFQFAEFVKEHNKGNVFEIGAGHGKLSSLCSGSVNSWTCIDPNPPAIKNPNVKYVRGFFDNSTDLSEINTIVHSHVIEHIYDLQNFLRTIAEKFDDGSRMVFSMPNMIEMLKRKYLNCINFEHTILISENLIEHLLSVNGFKLIDKKKYLEDHSIFYCFEKEEACKLIPFDMAYEENKRIFLEYVDFYKNFVSRVNEQIKDVESVYVFGAHVFSQYLLNFGLSATNIVGCLDNDVNKQGRRLYGTPFKVFSPSVLAQEKRPTVILKTGAMKAEIQSQLLSINASTVFLE